MTKVLSLDIVKEIYKKRDKSSKKYDHGLVIVVGGSRLYTGSPLLSALSAMRAGADVAQIIAPERVADVAANFSPEIISLPLKGDHLEPNHLSELLALVRIGEDVSHGRVAVVIGGGIGRDEKTKKTVREFVKTCNAPLVIDADAIYAFEKQSESVLSAIIKKTNIIFTPHLYEFFILSGKNIKNLKEEERVLSVKETARALNATILLKGPIDYISDGGEIAINKESVPYMTAGGTGDILAGIVGALLSRSIAPFDAACCGAVMNTAAGKMVVKEKSDGLMAMDVVSKIPAVICKAQSKK